jgi:hypothetical protein
MPCHFGTPPPLTANRSSNSLRSTKAKTYEKMAANGRVGEMEHRPGRQQCLCDEEFLFNRHGRSFEVTVGVGVVGGKKDVDQTHFIIGIVT